MATAALTAEYEAVSAAYDAYATATATGVLEHALFRRALDAWPQTRDARVVDLGGGTGLKTRLALDAGAAAVDVVDLSASMLRAGRAALGGGGDGRVRWLVGDAAAAAGGARKYDLALAGWIFDHAYTPAQLDAMWANLARLLRPGGRLIGVRCNDPRSASAAEGKYGARFTDHEPMPGGLKYRYLLTPGGGHPAVECAASSLEASYAGAAEVAARHGFAEVRVLPCADAEVVRRDPAFWEGFVREPFFAVFTATRMGG
ncbi:methyltransferase-like protein [Xylariomycetidae sp. FL0641]|nr:methyltransferase-like protein [Xylariomycetidae sp. FL0641]